MTDFLTPAQRSERMGRIRGKNTAPELALRSALHRKGFRFRLHRKDLPGKPDLVFPRYKSVVLVHGCFWHRHRGCNIATTPKTNTDFWTAKFDRNVQRDRKNASQLEQGGWRVFVVWECELASAAKVQKVVSYLASAFRDCRP
jgi:DNA mismatch endonuclease (patch repair protein)